MRLLLDSHALVWFWFQPQLLSQRVRTALFDVSNEVFVSAVTAYELLSKRDRDPTLAHLPDDFEKAVLNESMMWLSMTPDDAIRAARLPRHHGDPWDRVLIAQAVSIDAMLVTQDKRIPEYRVTLFW